MTALQVKCLECHSHDSGKRKAEVPACLRGELIQASACVEEEERGWVAVRISHVEMWEPEVGMSRAPC